jgi:hypothetical protein
MVVELHGLEWAAGGDDGDGWGNGDSDSDSEVTKMILWALWCPLMMEEARNWDWDAPTQMMP